MALTLAESAKLSQDMLLTGVIETVIKESPVLQTLPFIEVVGNGLTYNQENALPTAAFYAVGDTWVESTPTFTQVTANLKILGGDADVDNFIKATRSNLQDLEATVVELKAKATQQKFDDTFIEGDTVSDANSFDGIDKLAISGQTVSMGANGGTLTLD
ncbi:MAG: phage major capsid protein [Chloroflexi bacterium]|nr:phage major capsid protein [Chloroflexota bacterium]